MNMKADNLAELAKEATIGGMGTTVDREIPVIDLSDFENRKHEIADALWQASVDIGFFQVYNHGIAQDDIDAAFDTAWTFFELPAEVKAKPRCRRAPMRVGNSRRR